MEAVGEKKSNLSCKCNNNTQFWFQFNVPRLVVALSPTLRTLSEANRHDLSVISHLLNR